MDTPRTLGQVIRTRRQALGLTQELLAERIGDGVRQAEVSRLESDRVALPRRRRLERIATALELPLGHLLATAGWTGAESAFPSPVESTEPAESQRAAHGSSHDALPELARELPPLTDLRQALVRSQELHWQSLQVLAASRELADQWQAGRLKRPAHHAE